MGELLAELTAFERPGPLPPGPPLRGGEGGDDSDTPGDLNRPPCGEGQDVPALRSERGG